MWVRSVEQLPCVLDICTVLSNVSSGTVILYWCPVAPDSALVFFTTACKKNLAQNSAEDTCRMPHTELCTKNLELPMPDGDYLQHQ